MQHVFDDVMEFLPRLLGAVIIVSVGSGLLMLAWLLCRPIMRKVRSWSEASARVLAGIGWLFLVLVQLVVLSLGANTLGIGALQSAFDSIIETVPKIIVALVLLAAGVGINIGIIRFGRSVVAPRVGRAPNIAVALKVGRALILLFVGSMVGVMVVDQIAGGVTALSRPPLFWLWGLLIAAGSIWFDRRSVATVRRAKDRSDSAVENQGTSTSSGQ